MILKLVTILLLSAAVGFAVAFVRLKLQDRKAIKL